MHHKRRRPKNRRAGCLLCKPHKGNGLKGRAEAETAQDRKARASARAQLRDLRAVVATMAR